MSMAHFAFCEEHNAYEAVLATGAFGLSFLEKVRPKDDLEAFFREHRHCALKMVREEEVPLEIFERVWNTRQETPK